ncbi:hypothetical protein BC567DRAFT_237495 [Phyllosticta citribraziliensis]
MLTGSPPSLHRHSQQSKILPSHTHLHTYLGDHVCPSITRTGQQRRPSVIPVQPSAVSLLLLLFPQRLSRFISTSSLTLALALHSPFSRLRLHRPYLHHQVFSSSPSYSCTHPQRNNLAFLLFSACQPCHSSPVNPTFPLSFPLPSCLLLFVCATMALPHYSCSCSCSHRYLVST